MQNWKSFDFDLQPENIKPKKEKVASRRNPKRNLKINVEKSIYNELVPQTSEDLAVHPKKIEEIENWLLQTRTEYPLLLLSGPTGSGKTTVVNVLCKKWQIEVSEWINPTEKDRLIDGSTQISRFTEFLLDSKWNSLFGINSAKKITLVKDFPHAIIHQPEEFLSVLNECYKLKCPVVFICTDTSSSYINITRVLFTEDTMNKYKIAHISLNKCAPTLMKTALKRAYQIIRQSSATNDQLPPSTISAIVTSSMGDIRNAMNQLCLCFLETSSESRKQCNTIELIDKMSMSRDQNWGFFHGLGKVLHPKREQKNNTWHFTCDVEKLVEEFSIQPNIIISFLFENYLKYFGNVNDASKAASSLSLSIDLMEKWLEQHKIFGLWISILGLMVYNGHKVSKWNQIRGPTRINDTTQNSRTVVNPVDGCYYNIIKNTTTFPRFKQIY